MRFFHYYPSSFFDGIRYDFGLDAVRLLKSWIKYRKSIIKNRLKIEFLYNCIKSDINPQHINHCLKNLGNSFFSYKVKCKFFQYKNNLYKKLIRAEIKDSYCIINSAHTQIFKLSYEIYHRIPVSVCNSFFVRQSGPLFTYFINERRRLVKKFNFLSDLKQRNNLKDIRPIRYFFRPASQSCSLTNKELTVSFKSDNISRNVLNNETEIRVDPSSFDECQQDLTRINDKWFINMSSTCIPKEVQSLLQLGDNFSLPVIDAGKLTVECIKSIENNIRKLPINNQVAVRSRSANLLNDIPHYSSTNKVFFKKIINLDFITKKFLRDNQNLIVTRADKGNVTVALNRDFYIGKVEDLLKDKETYITVKKDPSRIIISKSRELLTRWRVSGFISAPTYRRLYNSDGILPRAYGLPKIHKVNCPFRLIVSSLNSPLYQLASYLHNIMFKSFPTAHSHVSNSFHLVNKLSDVHIGNNFGLISLDVISLFTNIPIETALNSISERWQYISGNCDIPMPEFMQAIKLILDSTFFSFNGTVYRQTYGSPMGSPLSPIIADIVLQDLEKKALETLRFTPPLYFRYVDDIIMAVPDTMKDHTLSTFNSFHARLQFTLEDSINNCLSFLDVTLILINNSIICDWYHKPTFSGRYLNFMSQHPMCQKRGTIIGLVDRAFRLSHPMFHSKNLKLVIKILQDNSYPLNFIFRIMHERLKLLITVGNNNMDVSSDMVTEGHSSFFTVPFVSGLTDQFRSIIKDCNVKLSYFSLNKLKHHIKVHKDPLPKSSRMNVVYKINCNDCSASYVGQTGRRLGTRIGEHRSHINRNMTNNSVITDHKLKYDHEFDWDNVEILDDESFFHKRLISEMIYIKRQENSLNLQTDTDCLHHSYINIIDKLQKL